MTKQPLAKSRPGAEKKGQHPRSPDNGLARRRSTMIPQGIEPPVSSPDDPAFTAEFDRFWKQVEPAVLRYVLPMLNNHHADAENATQETARKLLRYWGGGFRPDAWRGWVLTIARNEA